MKFNPQPFDIVKFNKENALIWGSKMWFILTDVYKSDIDKLRKHKLWLEGIALAVIYQEFIVSLNEEVERVEYKSIFSLTDYQWDETTLAYLASEKHLGYKFFEPYSIESRDQLLQKLVEKSKEYIFYSLVKHYSSVNAVFEELLSSINTENNKLSFDNYLAFEYVREGFILSDLY